MHDDELEISDDLVRRLVDRDAPYLSDRPLRRLEASGSTNALFRLGAEHLVRLPRQPGGGTLIEAEARWLPYLASALPVEVPKVIAVCEPGFGYSERWAFTSWIDGDLPTTLQESGSAADALACDLAVFARALHAIEVSTEALNDPVLRSYRTGPLSDVDADIRKCIEDCRSLADLPLDLDACLEVWTAAVAVPAACKNLHWVHADLLAENLLVLGDRLTAVLDFGALSIGDPSVDLIVAWEVFGPAARQVFRSELDVDDATWQRGRGWALAIAVMTFSYYWKSMPSRCSTRLAMAHQILAHPS